MPPGPSPLANHNTLMRPSGDANRALPSLARRADMVSPG